MGPSLEACKRPIIALIIEQNSAGIWKCPSPIDSEWRLSSFQSSANPTGMVSQDRMSGASQELPPQITDRPSLAHCSIRSKE